MPEYNAKQGVMSLGHAGPVDTGLNDDDTHEIIVAQATFLFTLTDGSLLVRISP